jgi:hypothetical protein
VATGQAVGKAVLAVPEQTGKQAGNGISAMLHVPDMCLAWVVAAAEVGRAELVVVERGEMAGPLSQLHWSIPS